MGFDVLMTNTSPLDPVIGSGLGLMITGIGLTITICNKIFEEVSIR